MENAPKPVKKQIKLEIPKDTEAVYSNQVLIGHTPSEFVLSFAQLLPGNLTAMVKSQVMMSPIGAKLFYKALSENLAKYEVILWEDQFTRRHIPGRELIPPPPEVNTWTN